MWPSSLRNPEGSSGRSPGHRTRHPRSGRALFNLGYAALASDQTERAVRAYQKAYDLGFRQATSAYNLACSYSRANQKDLAFEWLERAMEMNEHLVGHLISDPDLDNLRDDPRFPAMDELKRKHEEFLKQKKLEEMALKKKQKKILKEGHY